MVVCMFVAIAENGGKLSSGIKPPTQQNFGHHSLYGFPMRPMLKVGRDGNGESKTMVMAGAPVIGHDITWGHVALWAAPEVSGALFMVAGGLLALEEAEVNSVVVYDAHRCIPLDLNKLITVGPDFALAPADSKCEAPAATLAIKPCPNSIVSLRRLDYAAIGISHDCALAVQDFLSIALDPRICRSYDDLSALTHRLLSPTTLSGCVQLVDAINHLVPEAESALVVVPDGLQGDEIFTTPCGHLSAVGAWDLERIAESATIPREPAPQLMLPGGLEVDDAIRSCVRDAVCDYFDGVGPRPPDPWSDGPAAFYRWLESPRETWRPGSSRYWDKLRQSRNDLVFAFPDPDGASAEEFRKWCDSRFVTELSSPVLSAPFDPAELVEVSKEADREPGVNVVGYLTKGLGLGGVARTIRDHARRIELPVAELPYWRSSSPTEVDISPPYVLPCKSNLVVVNADEIRFLMAETPSELWSDHFNAAYWFWETEQVPERFVSAAKAFDEIWVATEFVREALGQVLDVPVRRVPLPVRPLWENEVTSDNGDLNAESCRFLVTLDLNSVMVRKNPVAAIDAFKCAFPAEVPGGPSLLVKTMNGCLHPAEVHSLRRHAAYRSDIEVRDEVLSRSDQDALIASSSCLVSLHRSEGLGLHLAEAMALGVPVIATGYSGNLDFMNNSNSRLIDYELVDIDDAGPYTGCGKWAEPDVEAAARAMQELEGDRRYRMRLSEAARDSIRSYSQEAETSLGIALQELVAHPVGKSSRD